VIFCFATAVEEMMRYEFRASQRDTAALDAEIESPAPEAKHLRHLLMVSDWCACYPWAY
jgi:hypothetical protein